MHGRYTILRPLGKGGMGAVYLASETIANQPRQVVVKEMLDYYDPVDPMGEQRAKQRFRDEAATLVSLNYAGIPQIFDYFSDENRNYIVMQFIEGQNLATGLSSRDFEGQVIPGKPYPANQVRRWGVQICKVLEKLGNHNIVHMDIKPANLILDKSGDVWLVDFGTAKAQRVLQSGGQVGMQKSSVYGTAGYAPPEQYSGNVTPRSDVYGLAATLYHLMTDDDPRSHPFTFPKLKQLPPDIAAALERALAQDLSQRISASELRELLDVQTSETPSFRWKDGSISQRPAALAVLSNLYWDEAREYFLNGSWDAWFQSLHRNDLVSRSGQIKARNPNPDIALDTFLRVLDPSFPLPRMQTNLGKLDAGELRKGQKRTFNLEVQNIGAGCLHGQFTNTPDWVQITPDEFCTHQRQDFTIAVHTRKLAPTQWPHQAELVLDGGNAGQIKIPVQVVVRQPDWQKKVFKKQTLIFSSILVMLFLIITGVVFGAYFLVRSIVPLVGLSTGQEVLFTSSRDGSVDIYRLDSGGTERVTYSTAGSSSWSPVSELGGGVLFVSDRDGKREIYRLTEKGSERVTTTPGSAESWHPAPASDGSVLFVSNRDGKQEIYRLTVDGIERVTNSPGASESWAPFPEAGGDVLFTSNRDGKAEIYRLTNDGIERVTNSPFDSESVYPAVGMGGDVLFVSNRAGKWDIYRLDNDGVERVTNSPGNSHSWSPQPDVGGGLLFTSDRDGKRDVYRLTDDGVERVTNTPGHAESWLGAGE